MTRGKDSVRFNASCICGWTMFSLTSRQSFNDAGHLHCSTEHDRAVVYLLPPVTDDADNELPHCGWQRATVLVFGECGPMKGGEHFDVVFSLGKAA